MKKKLFITLVYFTCSYAFADIDLSELSGSWAMNCAQTQNSNGKQGYLIETYTFNKAEYSLERQWYKDSSCKENTESETQAGRIIIGKENSNNGFNPSGTYETKYKYKNKVEMGLLWINESNSKIRVARGFGKSQNTMLGLFEYKKLSK